MSSVSWCIYLFLASSLELQETVLMFFNFLILKDGLRKGAYGKASHYYVGLSLQTKYVTRTLAISPSETKISPILSISLSWLN